MPLKLKSWRKKKTKSEDGDSVSIASGSSFRSQEGEVQDAYVIAKEKDLPKLHRAAWKGDLTKVKQMTKNVKKSDLNARDKEARTPLHLACARGHGKVIVHFCALKASVNVADSDGCTPMHKVLESGCSACLKHLLDCGGDANMADKQGCTPLHVAAQLGNVEAATLLLERDARIDAIEKNGFTALHLATLKGHCKMATSLINDGADINARDGKGRTALMLAACDGRFSLVKLLTESKADPEVKDSSNFKAMDYAVTQNHQDCARLIENHEQQVEREAVLLKQLPPHRTSLVDTSLISAVFGLGAPPLDHRVDDVAPSKSEDTLSHASQSQQDSWPASDTEDEDPGVSSKPAASSKVNLRAGLERAKAVSPKKEPEVAPKPTSPEVNVSHLSGTVLAQQEEEEDNHRGMKPSPSDPLHYQLSTATVRTPDEGLPLPESEDHSTSSEWDTDDDASLPLSSPQSPILPATSTFDKPGLGSRTVLTSTPSPAGDDTNNPEGRHEGEGEQLPPETDTKPQEELPQETLPSDDEEVEVSELDSDFSLDGDLPDLGGYEPSTASDMGRSELVRRRSSAHTTPTDEKTGMRETPATMTSPVLTESSGVVVTPLSFTASTLDASSASPGKSPSGVCKDTELLEPGDSGDEIDRVVKELSFSEQKEDQKGEVEGGSPQEGSQLGGEEKPTGGEEKPPGDEFDDSDWDTEEEEEVEEELEEELSGTASAMPEGKREPRKAPPALPKVDYFSYYDSNSEEEDEVENSVLPSAATGDKGNETPEERVPSHIPTSPVCALDKVKAAREQKLPPLTTPTLPPLTIHTPPSLTVQTLPSLTVHTPPSSLPVSPTVGKPTSMDIPETSRTGEASEQKTPLDLSQSSGSGDSETESEWEREQRLKKQGKNPPELQLDSGLGTMAASSQASVKAGGAQSPVECVPTHDVLHQSTAAVPSQFTPEGIDVKSPTSETTPGKRNVERIGHQLQSSLEEDGTRHSSLVVPSGSTGNPGHDKGPAHSVQAETSADQGRPRGPADDLDAARNEMEEEAARRFHERQNEFQILMKSRGERTDRTWVSPRQKAEKNSQWSPTHSPGIGSQDHGMETSDTGGAVLVGKSRVQLMKEMWESGSVSGQKGVAESLVKADSSPVRAGCSREQSSPSPRLGSRVKSPETSRSDVPDQETAPQPEVQPETEALSLQRIPPQTPLDANNPSNQSCAVTDNLEDSEDEILELLSESGSEEEGEEEEEVGGLLFEPSLETKPPEFVPEQGIVTPAECTENTVQKPTLTAKPPLQGEPQHVSPKGQEQPVLKASLRLPNLAESDHQPAPAVTEGAATPTCPQPAVQPLNSGDNISDLSHARTPLPLTSPFTRSHLDSSPVTRSHLDSSPLHLHHLQLTPSHVTPHNCGGGQSGQDRMNLGDLSVSDLTSPAETQSHNPPSGSHDLPSESHDDLLSGSYDPPSESNDPPSGSHHLDDLPLSPLLRLSQSGMGGASMISSAHTVQLQESLREARKGLERSQDAQVASERSRRQLKAQLEELQKKYDDIYSAKLKLESAKLDMELQVRELRYQLEQEREGHHGSDMVGTQLREQLEKLDGRVSREMEGRQDAELRRRELEIEHHSFKIANQQLQDEVVDLTAQLQNERDAQALQEGLYKEQIKMFQTLQEESSRTQQQKSDVLSRLQAVDLSKQGLEERLTELQRTNAQLQVELAGECRRAEDHVTRLEGEVEVLKERLQEKTEKQVLAENSLLEARQQFEAHLSELRSKAELLSSHLEEEATQRKSTEHEVSSLHSRLERTSSELQKELQGHAEEQHRLKEVAEGAQREKMLVERDLSSARDSAQQLQSRVDALEGRASLADGEVKSQQALLLERANQIASLQREVDHRNLQMSALEDAIRKEKDRSSKLEVQLSSASERLASSRSEVAQLRQQVEFAGRRAEEKETSALQTQEKFSAIFDSLRADQEKSKELLEERYRTLSEQLGAVKEDLVRKEVEAGGHQQESERLLQELSSLQEAQGEVEETLRATEEAYHELEEEKKEVEMRVTELEEKVTALEALLTEAGQQGELQQQKVASLEQSLSHAQDSNRNAFSEKSSVAEQKSQLESEVLSLQGQLSHLQGELHGGNAREEQLRGQVEHLSQVRSDLEATASKLQGEVVGLQRELDQAKVALDRAVREAEESRGLWEMEVKSRSKLGMKVLEMERSQGDVNTLMDVERKRTHKALELKKVAELKCDSLHERNAQLQRELGTYRSHLKTAKKRTRELELNESQIPSLRAEFDREQSSLVGEVSTLRRHLEETQDQLRREAEVRMKADLATGRARQELEAAATKASLSHSEVLSKQKEVRKMERSNRKLRDELKALQDHVTANMVDKRDLEVYRRAVEETARQELNTKLEEVNTYLEQQSQAQEAMEKQRANSESEMRQKFGRSSEELRMQLSQALADKQSLTAEGKRYKELYESELQRSERLSGHLQRAKEEAIESKTKLSLERNRTQHLLNATQSAASHLTSSPYTPHTAHPFTTSTPLKFNLQGDRSPTDDLLTSVRSELDKSIARHLDSVPPPRVSVTKATRSTYRKPRENATDSVLLPSKFSRDSHLDTIRRSYHI